MITSTFRSAIAVLVVALSGCALSPRTNLVGVASGEYELTKRSGYFGSSKPADLKYEAEQEALDYCTPRGGKLTIIDSRTTEARGADFASASVLFRCG